MYIPLARKYRPQDFNDLVGREVASSVIRKSISSNKVPNSYLFAGMYGTGKTTLARIVAKALNCPNVKEGNSCAICDTCILIADSRFPDVIEIDAGSHAGVDDAREMVKSARYLPKYGKCKVYIIDECFRYEDKITLANGTKELIGKIVNQKLSKEVLSFNTKVNKIESKKIVRWMRKWAVKPMIKIKLNCNITFGCTLDHKIYTPIGKVRAIDLKIGQKVYVNEKTLTKQQEEIIFGCLLGDANASLTTGSSRGRIRFIQGIKQKEYLYYKYELFKDITKSPPSKYLCKRSYSKLGVFRFNTRSLLQLGDICKDLYKNKVKTINEKYLNSLTPLSIAFWYMDDGCLHASKQTYKIKSGEVKKCISYWSSFSTHCFSEKEIELIIKWFYKKWDIVSKIKDDSGRGFVIYFSALDTKKLHDLIKEYIHPSMNYKLLPKYRGFFQRIKMGISLNIYPAMVKKVRQMKIPYYVFNIEVEDNHNYFINNTLVENCHSLSRKAWDALLKTIEESLPTVKFIFCTTAFLKVPDTIISRSQVYKFDRLSKKDIFNRLKYISQKEKFSLEDYVLEKVVLKSKGSMRDAIVLLEMIGTVKNDNDMIDTILHRVEVRKFINLLFSLDYAKSFEYMNQFPTEDFLDSLLDYICKVIMKKTYDKNFDCGLWTELLKIVSEWNNSIPKSYNRIILNEIYIIKLVGYLKGKNNV